MMFRTRLNILTICFGVFVLVTACRLSTSKELLFVGNSFTSYHDMPSTLQQMLNEREFAINVHQCTSPGISLSQHLENPETLKQINERNWDLVILQEATVRVLIPEVREYKFEPSVKKLDSIIKLKNSRTILYQSYTLAIYPEKYCYPEFLISKDLPEGQYCSDDLKSTAQEFEVIENAFKTLSQKIDCTIAPVGLGFELCKSTYPELKLYESDSHPSALGSYLIACVFFKVITKESPIKIKHTNGLNQYDVDKVKKVVDALEM